MIASLIAYGLTLFFGAVGIYGLYQTCRSPNPMHSANSWIVSSIMFLLAAMVCAKVGGI